MKVRLYSSRMDVLDSLQALTSGWTRRKNSLEYAQVEPAAVTWLQNLIVSVSARFDARIMLDVTEDS